MKPIQKRRKLDILRVSYVWVVLLPVRCVSSVVVFCIAGLSGRPGVPYSRTDEERLQPNWIASIATDCRLHHGQFFFGLYFTSSQYVSFGKFKQL